MQKNKVRNELTGMIKVCTALLNVLFVFHDDKGQDRLRVCSDKSNPVSVLLICRH